ALDARATARGSAFAFLAAAYDRLGERDLAAACYPRLLPFRGHYQLILVDRALALAAGAAGDVRSARRHLEAAEASARRAGMRPELALTLLLRGVLDGDAGRGALAEGRRLCETLGMEAHAEWIAGRAPNRKPRGLPAGLTAREAEVLRLIAAGRTNREIAG